MFIASQLSVAGETSSPFVLVGVNHGIFVGQTGLDAVPGCRSIVIGNGFDDVHVIILESAFSVFNAKGLYKPVITVNPIAVVREPFSTPLVISI